MRNKVTAVLTLAIFIFALFTTASLWRVIQAAPHFPESISGPPEELRIVLITEEQSTTFWQQVERGAKAQASEEGVLFETWGGFGTEDQDFLTDLETAIYSKVDGILVQGQDSEAFKELTKIKAAFYGVPIVTVGQDVPAEDSLRKTYVGSDQRQAGRLLAERMAEKMDFQGEIIVVGDEIPTYTQNQRLAGVEETIRKYPSISLIYQGMGSSREQVMNATMERLNQSPDASAWLILNANHSYFLTQEISRRTQVEPHLIYTFDDAPDSTTLLKAEVIDGVIKQQPREMGSESLRLLVEWIRGETVPLNSDGYMTPISLEESGGGL